MCWSEEEKMLMPRHLHLDCECLLVDCLFSLNLTQINGVKNNFGGILDLFFVSTNINGVLSKAGNLILIELIFI